MGRKEKVLQYPIQSSDKSLALCSLENKTECVDWWVDQSLLLSHCNKEKAIIICYTLNVQNVRLVSTDLR